jgi:hypothetical protein
MRRSQHGLAGRVRAYAARIRSAVRPPFMKSCLRFFGAIGDDTDAAPILNSFVG